MANSEPSKSLVSERSGEFSGVEPTDAGQIKCGNFVLLSVGAGASYPCKVVEAKFPVNGKHGTSKAIFVGIDLFTKRKYTWGGPSNTLMYAFKPERKEYTLIDVAQDHDVANYLDEKDVAQSIRIPVDLGNELAKALADDHPVEIKILRAPSRTYPSQSELYSLQAVESFRIIH